MNHAIEITFERANPSTPFMTKPLMQTLRTLMFALVVCAVSTGCGLNAVKPLPVGTTANQHDAVLVYGLGVEADRGTSSPMLSLSLAEYSLEDQAITGNCFRFNQTQALVPAVRGDVQYFAFAVPPGHYAGSPFSTSLDLATTAFSAPAGRVVYVGSIIYTGRGKVELRRDELALMNAQKSVASELRDRLTLADTVTVTPPRPFLCAP